MNCRTVCAWPTWGASVVLRAAVGAVFVAHGWDKINDPGPFIDNIAGMGIPMPAVAGWLSIIAEFFGGLGLLAGLLTRFSAAALVINMAVAVFVAHGAAHGGHFTGAHGFEYPLTLGAANLALLLLGPGPLSLDALALRMWRRRDPAVAAPPPAATP